MTAEQVIMEDSLRDFILQRREENLDQQQAIPPQPEIGSNYGPPSPSIFTNSTSTIYSDLGYNTYEDFSYEHHQQQQEEPIFIELQPVDHYQQQEVEPQQEEQQQLQEVEPQQEQQQQQQSTCSICFECNSTNYPTEIKCGHVYHYNCIQEWLLRNPRCPNCRHYSTIEECSILLF